MSTNSFKYPKRKEKEDDSHHVVKINTSHSEDDSHHVVKINTSHSEVTQDYNKYNNTKENETEKSECKEIVLEIDENDQENMKTGINKDYMVYGSYEYNQNKNLPTTWVYFQVARRDDESDPLDYTPDRNSFVRLVFIIVFIMLAVTTMMLVIVFITPGLTNFFRTYGAAIAIPAMITSVGLSYAMACSSCSRHMPGSIICLILVVIVMTLICCFITVRYRTQLVLLAALATAGVVLVCTLLACTSFDFTKWLLYVIVIAAAFVMVALFVFMYFMISGNYIPIAHLVILCVGTALSSIILIIQLQVILGGKTIELSEDDYALAAYLLYTSILDIFLKLVMIGGFLDDD